MHNIVLRRPSSVFNLLDDLWYPQLGFESGSAEVPAVDIKEEDKRYVLTAELPGLTEKEIGIDVNGSYLTIRSNKEGASEKESDTFILKERSSMSFSRTFALSKKVDTEKIEATFENGILTIVAQKKEEEHARRIAVKINGGIDQPSKRDKK